MDIRNFSLSEAQILQNKLMVDEGLPIAYAAILTEEALYRFDERVREGVRLWIKDGLGDDFSVDDISIADIREEVGLKGFGALGFLDVYLKRKEFAENDVKWFEEVYL